jgi:opacity protein-like surface antigen
MIVGGEVDFGYNPNFFGSKNDFGSNTGIDLMGNFVLRAPLRGALATTWHPYVTAGLGWIRAGVEPGAVSTVDHTDNMFGWNVGAGTMGHFATHVGLRGDIRYLRSFSSFSTGVPVIDLNDSHLHWWRLSGGVVLR